MFLIQTLNWKWKSCHLSDIPKLNRDGSKSILLDNLRMSQNDVAECNQ